MGLLMLDVLISLLIVVLVMGIVAYVIQQFLPLDPRIKHLALLILGVLLLIWVLLILFGQAPLWRWPRSS
jgi:hypothetical protein